MSALSKVGGARRVLPPIIVAVLAAIVAGLTYSQLQTLEPQRTPTAPPTVMPSLSTMFDKATMLVVGDSYAAGTGDAQVVTYPHLIAKKFGWNLVLDAQPGTGFIAGGADGPSTREPFMDRLAQDAATPRVDYILIDGGREDLGQPADRVVAAAGEYIDKVRADFPHASIIVMVPTPAKVDVAPDYPEIAHGLQVAAEKVGGYVIDPVVERWYFDSGDKQLLSADGIHLNSDGQSYYADKIVANMTALEMVA